MPQSLLLHNIIFPSHSITHNEALASLASTFFLDPISCWSSSLHASCHSPNANSPPFSSRHQPTVITILQTRLSSSHFYERMLSIFFLLQNDLLDPNQSSHKCGPSTKTVLLTGVDTLWKLDIFLFYLMDVSPAFSSHQMTMDTMSNLCVRGLHSNSLCHNTQDDFTGYHELASCPSYFSQQKIILKHLYLALVTVQ